MDQISASRVEIWVREGRLTVILVFVCSEAECEEVIQLGEDWGIGEEDFKVSEEMRIRTSNRTNSYCNEELTVRMNPRLPEQLLDAVEASTPYTSVRGIHPNWRVARYQEGQTFPAHQAEWTTPELPDSHKGS